MVMRYEMRRILGGAIVSASLALAGVAWPNVASAESVGHYTDIGPGAASCAEPTLSGPWFPARNALASDGPCGGFYRTYSNNTAAAVSVADYTFYVSGCGTCTFQISAWIPAATARAHAAHYHVDAAGFSRGVDINQAAHHGWVLLAPYGEPNFRPLLAAHTRFGDIYGCTWA